MPSRVAALHYEQQLSTDRGFIYYTAWTCKQVRKYDRQAGHVVETANVPFYPDNINVRADGMVVVTGIDDLQSWKACVLAERSSRDGIHCDDFGSSHPGCEPLYHAPPGTLSGASVAVQVRNRLYVGSCMGDRLLEVDLSVEANSHSKKD